MLLHFFQLVCSHGTYLDSAARIPSGRLPPRSSPQECPAERFGEQAEDLLVQILFLVPVKLAMVTVQWSSGQEKTYNELTEG